MFTLTAKVPDGVGVDGLEERLREELKSRPDLSKDPPPRVGLQPNVEGGLTIEVRYWLDYRKNDPLAIQAEVLVGGQDRRLPPRWARDAAGKDADCLVQPVHISPP